MNISEPLNKSKETNINIIFTDDQISINLKLISKLKPNEKLIFNNDTNLFSVDNTYIQQITRLYFGYNRNTTIKYIDYLIMMTFQKINFLKENYHKLNNLNTQIMKYTNELNNVIDGLINLKITYQGDQLIQSKLDCIIEKIRDNISNDKIILNLNN
jgi:hypothetical protein